MSNSHTRHKDHHYLLVQCLHPVSVSPVSAFGQTNFAHLLSHRNPVVVSKPSQLRQGRPTARATLHFSNGRVDLGGGVVHASTAPEKRTGARCSARRASLPIHYGAHLTAQAGLMAEPGLLLTPMPHQAFNVIDHRPSPRKTEPNTEKPLPNTNPTQIKLFKINTFNNIELGVLGLLSFSVLA
ncbi:hypothetical protein [Pseudomonas sp. ES3]|uniref:hypothetical protein n=1 Tax=Pseudomonas sp. ES3 TaxID=3424776 RepID=UPI003D338E7B